MIKEETRTTPRLPWDSTNGEGGAELPWDSTSGEGGVELPWDSTNGGGGVAAAHYALLSPSSEKMVNMMLGVEM